jgi:hypothetical protein
MSDIMPEKNRIIICVCLLGLSSLIAADDARAVRPLADDYIELYRSDDPQNVCAYTPGLAVCPDGRIAATFELGGSKAAAAVKDAPAGSGKGFVYTSDDHGRSWQYRTNFPIVHARPLAAGKSLYILGHDNGKDLKIIRSDDRGDTWTEPALLTSGQNWHASATNVWHKDDFVYCVLEKRTRKEHKGWYVSELAPVLLRANIHDDLTEPKSWTHASELTFCEAIDDREIEWFAVPFYDQFYPGKNEVAPKRTFHASGWLEANVVQILAPDHYWYDPAGRTFHIWLRCHTGVTNIACLVKAVEQKDGSIKTMLETAPSGKKMAFVPFPGGHLRFHVVYDKETKLYWLVNSQSTDSMTRPDMLGPDRHSLAYNQRSRLALHFSKNMVDWCFAGIVSIGPSERSARHYASMVIYRDDLLILSRSGDLQAKTAHDGNIITLHTVKDFRKLVY